MTDTVPNTNALANIRQDGGRQAIVGSMVVILCLAMFGALFPVAATRALRVWMVSPTYNHCFLVLPISLFMIWQRRRALRNARFATDFRAVIAILFLSVAWFLTSAASVLEAEQFVIMTMVEAALLGILGATIYRSLAAPFLYLYFLVPSGEFLIPALQAFTARFAVAGLHVLGIPVFSNGAVIEIPGGTFAVAEACAGLRFLVAAVAFGVFFAVLTYRSPWRRTAFIALSVVVPIIANGFRALGLIAVAQWVGSPTAALADHIIYGWIFFSFVLVVLIIVGLFFSDTNEARHRASDVQGRTPVHPNISRMALVLTTCVLVAALGPVSASLLDTRQALPVPEFAPRVAWPWHEAVAPREWTPVVVKPTRSFLQTFVAGTDQIDRFVALYGAQGRGNNLIRSENHDADERMWTFDSARSGVLSVHGRAIPVRVATWLRGAERRIIWSFYAINAREVSGLWQVKWNQLRANLTTGNCVSAYVALSTKDTDEPTGAREATRILAATEPLASYLCSATKAQARR